MASGFPGLQVAQVEAVGLSLLAEAVIQCVGDELELGAPPSIERGATHAGVGCDVAESHARVAVLDETGAGGQDDRLVEGGVARTPAGT